MKRILIVEDNALNLELAQDILESAGYEVLSAGNADECMAAIVARLPDLILMDIQLPGRDGLQITRDLRANPATRDLIIVAMTAHALPEDERLVLGAGCDGYLTKPIQTRTLAADVARFVETGPQSSVLEELRGAS